MRAISPEALLLMAMMAGGAALSTEPASLADPANVSGATADRPANATATKPKLRNEVLTVGTGQKYSTLQKAADAVVSGETVSIQPGNYPECAVWPSRASNITIEGTGDVVVSDNICAEKALFVIQGDDVTVRGITFAGAHAPEHNGAGIRAEGTNLTIEDSRFIDNEEGILAGTNNGGTIIVRSSLFQGNGKCVEDCAHGIYVGRIDRLRIEDSRFLSQHIGHHIKSRALRTEIIGNTIRDGATGTASYLIDIPVGGSVLIRGNHLEKGPHAENPTAAVVIGAEAKTGLNATPEIKIENNEFANDMEKRTVFVRNLTTTPAKLHDNRITGKVLLIEGPGSID